MNDIELAKQMIVAVAMGAIIGAPAAQVVQAVRARVPSLDGWKVLVAVVVAAAVIMALFLPPVTVEAALVFGRTVVFAFISAVGTDALLSKYAGKVGR